MNLIQFYLIALITVCLFLGAMLYSLFYQSSGDGKASRGALFLSLVYFSWALVALYKYFDPQFPSLIHAVSDRVFSSFSNLFLLSALPYFSPEIRLFGRKFRPGADTDRWTLGVVIFFVIVTTVFVGLERAFDNDGVRKAVVIADSLISLATLTAVLAALLSSARRIWENPVTPIIVAVGMVIFIISQVILAMSLLFPDLLRPYYAFGLISVFLGIVLLGVLSILFFTFELKAGQLQSPLPASAESEPAVSYSELSPVGLSLGYDEKKKMYFLRITFSGPEDTSEDTVYLKKLLKPFANWLVFAAAGRKSVKLEHEDMAMIKFRMVEFWNKNSGYPITQEDIFHNDGGRFELTVPAGNIHIAQGDFLSSRYMIRENFKEFSSSFSPQMLESLSDLLADGHS